MNNGTDWQDKTIHFGQQVAVLERESDGRLYLHTTLGQKFLTTAVIVASGAGSFAPVKLKIPGVEERVGQDVFYSIKNPEQQTADGDSAPAVLRAVEVTGGDGVARTVELDHLLVFFGLSPKLSSIANWGLGLNKNQIRVDTEKFQSSEPGLYAVGDINWYPGKKKLILSGFHEAALAAFAIKEQLNPGQKVHLQNTTASPVMHQRLGVDDPYQDEFEAA